MELLLVIALLTAACYGLSTALMLAGFSLLRGHRGERYGNARLFALASALTAAYLFAHTAIHAGPLLERPGWAEAGYRAALAMALVAGWSYLSLLRHAGRTHGSGGTQAVWLVAVACALLLALAFDGRYSVIEGFTADPRGGPPRPQFGAGAWVYFAAVLTLVTYIAAAMTRRLWRERHKRAPWIPGAGLVACLTAYHDVVRLLGPELLGLPLLWLALTVLHAALFATLTKQYADLSLSLEGRETEIRRLRRGQLLDAGTGLFGRTMLEQQLRLEYERLQRGDARGGMVLLVELPELAQLLPNLSQTYADIILREVAETLKACIRQEDVAGRWGRYTFLVLIKTPEPERAQWIVARIRNAVRGLHFDFAPSLRLELNMGIARLTADGPDQWQSAVAEADRRAHGEVTAENA